MYTEPVPLKYEKTLDTKYFYSAVILMLLLFPFIGSFSREIRVSRFHRILFLPPVP